MHDTIIVLLCYGYFYAYIIILKLIKYTSSSIGEMTRESKVWHYH